ncbi:4'-phosphopantetheinyl transferase family protein [Streptomyces sp. NPDC053780]|uniref:4'-phosphopantetheinyl transferase family protein n=1 Tax=unclassified Streptomyces TaxID=2593676 RepID=UPI000F74BA6F|nr:4'-phosphopantetheinyl transferase superfamily protein [Streptomyces sp. WAC 04229]RSN44301.1 phosphopantetheinyl transferase [Streptomyces sp. WAC 04229]
MTAAYEVLKDSDAVHIWYGRAPDGPAPADTGPLSEEESRAVRRLPEPAAARYAAAHVAVRRVLSGYLGVPPGDVVLGRQPCPRCAHARHGRPRVHWPPTDLDFNLSRSGPRWALAVVTGRQVGVDLEDGRPLDVDGASRFVMSASELAHVRAAPDDTARSHAFFRCWTRKEAVVKAIGVGIVTDLGAIDVRPAEDGPVLVRHTEPTGPDTWLVEDLPRIGGAFAALARQAGGTGPVVLRRYPDGDVVHGPEHPREQTEQTREVLIP